MPVGSAIQFAYHRKLLDTALYRDLTEARALSQAAEGLCKLLRKSMISLCLETLR